MSQVSYITHRYLLKPLLQVYLRRDSTTSFDGFKIKVLKNVFHPRLFFSSTYFYNFLQKLDLNNKKLLEVGCGSGMLSMLALRKGAKVTAIDIDPKAVENTWLNFRNNFADLRGLKILQSDVFQNVPPEQYDIIIINPPYYFKNPELPGQMAWYCGENGEYFEKLFSGIVRFINNDSKVYIILEEKCEIDRIKNIAAKNGIRFEMAESKKIRWEVNIIFSLTFR